jgi:hypothetical protein
MRKKRPTYEEDFDADDDRDVLEQQTLIGTLSGPYRLILEPAGTKRQTPMGNYYFAAVVGALVTYCREQGDMMTKDEAHETLKRECGLRREIVNHDTGFVMMTLRRWRDYDEYDKWEYTQRCIAWLAQMGVRVMPPRPRDLVDVSAGVPVHSGAR